MNLAHIYLGMWVWSMIFIIKESGCTGVALTVGLFVVSFVCHYVWCYNYLYRSRKWNLAFNRFPNPWEIIFIVVNTSWTMASFVEIGRRICRVQFVLVPEWAVVLGLAYGGVVFLIHLYYKEIMGALGLRIAPFPPETIAILQAKYPPKTTATTQPEPPSQPMEGLAVVTVSN